MIDGEFSAAVLLGIEREQPPLSAEFFRQAAAEFVLVGVFAGRPGGRPAQMLVTFKLLCQPSATSLRNSTTWGGSALTLKSIIHSFLVVHSFGLKRRNL